MSEDVLYSAETGGFYLLSVHGPAGIPADAVAITHAQHAALLDAQATGQVIVAGPDGYPRAAPPPPPKPIRTISPYAFRLRLPPATRRAVTLAASRALEGADATLQTWLDDLSSTRRVDLDHPEIAAGVATLRGGGLITDAEAAALLADGTPDET